MAKLSDPMTQIIILGFICFCCPGMFNALSGTGSYGLDPKDSDVGNRAGTALSCLFAFSSLFAGALFNILGHRVLLILGEKGRYFSVFWAIFNLGGVLGNAIPIGIQWNSEKDGATDGAYIAYMVIMTIGAFLTILLLPTDKVFRKDGSPVVKIKYSSPIIELKSILKLFADWRLLALVP
ncbi:hypothetical protein BGZ92_002709, partial [Podila epicladia]